MCTEINQLPDLHNVKDGTLIQTQVQLLHDHLYCSELGLLFVAVHGLLIIVASLVVEHRL